MREEERKTVRITNDVRACQRDVFES